jgi:hypothetical protein
VGLRKSGLKRKKKCHGDIFRPTFVNVQAHTRILGQNIRSEILPVVISAFFGRVLGGGGGDGAAEAGLKCPLLAGKAGDGGGGVGRETAACGS